MICSNKCTITANKMTLKTSNFQFTAPANLVYDSSAKQAKAEANTGLVGGGDITVKDWNADGEWLSGAPVDAVWSLAQNRPGSRVEIVLQ